MGLCTVHVTPYPHSHFSFRVHGRHGEEGPSITSGYVSTLKMNNMKICRTQEGIHMKSHTDTYCELPSQYKSRRMKHVGLRHFSTSSSDRSIWMFLTTVPFLVT